MSLPKHLFIPSNEYRHYTSDDFGVYGVVQAKLVKAKLPVLPSFTLSPHFFSFFYTQETINNIQTHLEKNDAHQLNRVIKHISPSDEFLHELSKHIEQRNPNRLLSITLSPKISSMPSQTKVIPPSTSNGIQAIVELLIIYTQSFLHHQRKTRHDSLDTFTPAFFFQFQRKFEKSGIIWTTDPTQQNKQHMILKAWWGRPEATQKLPETYDTWIIQNQTGEILETQHHRQEMEYESNQHGVIKDNVPISRQERKKLSEEEVQELVKLAKKTQQQLFFPQRLVWVKRHNAFSILESTELEATLPVKKVQQNEEFVKKPLLTGTPMGKGSTMTHVKIIHSIQDLKKVKKSDIAVIKIFPLHILKEHMCSGIICESPLDHRDFLHWNIPIIGSCFAATKKLKDGDKVFIDSEERIVYC